MVTASLTMLPEVTRRVRRPRALAVPFPLGYPLGAPHDPDRQRDALIALLALCDATDVPLLATFSGRAGGGRTRLIATVAPSCPSGRGPGAESQ